MTVVLNKEIEKTILLAMHHHNGQLYGKRSYLWHLEEVVNNTKDIHRKKLFGAGELDRMLLIQGAYCHDLREDTKVTDEELKAISQELFDIVCILSKVEGVSHNVYLTKVKENPYTRVIKIADTYANLFNSFKAGHQKRIVKYTKQLEFLVADF